MENKNYSKILIKDLELDASIGIYDFEKEKKQKIIINVEILLTKAITKAKENINNTLSYEIIINEIKELVKKGHIMLVETLAEEIATICLNKNLCQQVKVKVEKPDIFNFVGSVGIEILRNKIN